VPLDLREGCRAAGLRYARLQHLLFQHAILPGWRHRGRDLGTPQEGPAGQHLEQPQALAGRERLQLYVRAASFPKRVRLRHLHRLADILELAQSEDCARGPGYERCRMSCRIETSVIIGMLALVCRMITSFSLIERHLTMVDYTLAVVLGPCGLLARARG
jgi:hypothetical protein